MKIPGAILQNNVQSLGRHDINAPLRVANAEAAASAQWAGVVEKAAKGFGDVFTGQSKARGALTLAELRAKHTTENNALQTLLENKRSFEVGGEGNPEQVEAYAENNELLAGEVMLTSDIMADVMSYQYKTSKEEAYTALEKEGFSNALKAEYVKGMTAQWTAGGESAVTVKALRQQEELVSRADANLESAVTSRDMTLALDVIDDAVDRGVYTVGEGITKKQGLPEQIDFQEYSQALQSDSIAELEGVSLTIWSDSNDMPNDMRASFQAKYENRITKLTNKHAGKVADTKAAASSAARVELTKRIMEDGVVSWDEITSGGMSSGDTLAVLSFNRSAQESRSTVSDPDAHVEVSSMVLDLAMPSDVPHIEKRDAVIAKITEALDKGLLTGNDAFTLMSKVGTMEKLPYTSPEFKQAQDRIYILLVGASKGSFTFVDKSAANKRNALEMESQLFDAMRSSGAGFDPNAWVRKNMHAYATKAYHESYNSLNKALVNAAIVRKGDGIRIDYPATRARLEEMARARSHDPGALKAFEGELRQLEEIDKSTVKVDE